MFLQRQLDGSYPRSIQMQNLVARKSKAFQALLWIWRLVQEAIDEGKMDNVIFLCD
jgi:hypothetical protein